MMRKKGEAKTRKRNTHIQIQKGRKSAYFVNLLAFVCCLFLWIGAFVFAFDFFFFTPVAFSCEHVFQQHIYAFYLWLLPINNDAWSFCDANERNDEHWQMPETNLVSRFYLCVCFFHSSRFKCWHDFSFYRFVCVNIGWDSVNKRLNGNWRGKKRKTRNKNNSEKQIFQSCKSIDMRPMIAIYNKAMGSMAFEWCWDQSMKMIFLPFIVDVKVSTIYIEDAKARKCRLRWLPMIVKFVHKISTDNRNVNEFCASFSTIFRSFSNQSRLPESKERSMTQVFQSADSRAVFIHAFRRDDTICK